MDKRWFTKMRQASVEPLSRRRVGVRKVITFALTRET
jgi:hypothetical protein